MQQKIIDILKEALPNDSETQAKIPAIAERIVEELNKEIEEFKDNY